MIYKYRVVTVRMHSGESMPLLLDSETGLGLFEPTVYALHLRSRSLATNTIGQALRSVQLLYQILQATQISLLDRIKANTLLTLGEVDALVEQCKLKKHDLKEIYDRQVDEKVSRLDITRLRKGLKTTTSLVPVARNTSVVRLKYVTGYLRWLVEYAYLQNLPPDRELFFKVGDKAVGAMSVRTPTGNKRNSTARRRGWTKQDEVRILARVHPNSPVNPWQDAFIRNRNHLIIGFLLGTGVRKSEMLGIKLADLKFSDNTVFIARRADDPEDPRRRPPTQKTYDRTLALGNDLIDQIKCYIKMRATKDAARKHPYLFVTEAGAPMAINTVDFMFSTVRQNLPGIKYLSAHICRHTWNDRFSELAEGKMKEAEEKKVRNYLMGWSDESRSAENYTARFVEKKAHEALIDLQNEIFKGAR